MGTENWSRIREIVEGALACSVDEREAYVERESAGDPALRDEALALLALEGRQADWLEPPREAFAGGVAGRRVGPWELSCEIGTGGMGAVYLAERADGEFRMRVAVKVLKRGMDTDDLLERFQRERQVLAALEHPGIARLIDGGATESGLPYLALEYVEGVPIDTWYEERKLSTRQRIQLFRKVCEAVQYAHRNLVVHRDLKPSNVLVTEAGEPKLLDFGIAKVLDPDAPAITRDATAGGRFMTPDYASPEQVRGAAVTTSSDVYSLGALLYHLLTGIRPHRFTTKTPLEIERVVCESAPERPSSAVASRARARELAGDLDTIVLKAMHKEPERRYGSVEQLAEDLRRHLAGLPVTARPDSVSYRLTKFVRRNRVSVGATAGVIGILALALWNSDRLYRAARSAWKEEEAQRTLAERRFEDVRELALQSVFEVAGQLAELPGTTELREQIVRTASERLDQLAQEAGDDVELWLDLGHAYLRLGDVQGSPFHAGLGQTERAMESYAKAAEIAGGLDSEGVHGAEVRDLRARASSARAAVLTHDGNHEEALALFEASLVEFEALGREDPSRRVPLDVRRGIAEVLTVMGRYEEAAAAFAAATGEARFLYEQLPTWENACSLDHALVAEARKLADQGELDRAEELLREALALLEEHRGTAGNELLFARRMAGAHHYLGQVLTKARPDEPEGAEHLERALVLGTDLVARDPRDLPTRQLRVKTLFTLGDRHTRRGEYELALEYLRDAEAEYVEGPAPDTEERRRELAIARDGIGKALHRLGRHEEAIEALELVRAYWLERVEAEPESARARRDLAVNAYFLGYPALERVPEDADPTEVAAACEASRAYFQECLDLLLDLDADGLLLEPDRAQIEHVRLNIAGLDDKLAGLEGAN